MVDRLRRLTTLAAAACLLAPVGNAANDVLYFDFDTPDASRYTIGDEISHRIALELAATFTLDADSLPIPGRVAGLLELRAPVVQRRGNAYAVTLVYQVMSVPLDDGPLVIPSFNLQITDGEVSRPVPVGEWRFELSRLVGASDATFVSAASLRPPAAPPMLSLAAHRTRLLVIAAAGAVAVAALAFAYLVLPWLARRRRPFATALRRLRRMDAASWDPAAERHALRLLHGAFNAAAGRALFASGLDRWFDEQPRYAALRGPVEAFFRRSERLFFAVGEAASREAQTLAGLQALCRRCRDVERSHP